MAKGVKLRSTINDFLNETWNKKTPDNDLYNFFSSQLIINNPLGKRVGVDSFASTNMQWLNAFPNLKLLNIDLSVMGNIVVAEWNSVGNHEGNFQDIKRTGNKISYHGVSTFCFNKDYKITRYLCQTDMTLVYKQLGFFMMQERYQRQEILHRNRKLLIDTIQNFSETSLTVREVECLCLFLNSYSAKCIAALLGISSRTVETYLSNAMYKFNCHYKNELVDIMRIKGLIPIWQDLFYNLAEQLR